MTNSIKAYLLLAVLVALMILAGQALGGREGMLIALFISFAMSFFSYWFSDKIVLTMYGAKEADPGYHGDLYRAVDELANRAGIPRPRVYIIPSSSPNAFATGRGPSHSAVAVTEGIMTLLSPEELKGVLAHEIAHIANYDILLSTIVATLAGALSMLSRMVMWGGLGGRRSDDERGGNPLLALIVMLLAPLVALLVQMAISRSREYLADETGAKLCGEPRWLANALARLQSGVSARPMSDAEPATAHMFIVKPFSGGGLLSLFSTHPPMEERIRRLQQMR
jgi:heat shock protein HtpX